MLGAIYEDSDEYDVSWNDGDGWILLLDAPDYDTTATTDTTTDKILVDSGAIAHVCPPEWAA